MRTPAAIAIAVATASLISPTPALAEEDDPKRARLEAVVRVESPPETSDGSLLAAEEDPKFQRLARVIDRGPRLLVTRSLEERHPAPVWKLAYRRLTLPNLDGSSIPLHTAELDLYPMSGRPVRLGIDLEFGQGAGRVGDIRGDIAGAEITVHSFSHSVWLLGIGLAGGFQYPARVTPYIEGRLVAGAIGTEILGKSVVSYSYMYGVEGGVELYVFRRIYLTAGAGWVRATYKGIDLDALRTNPSGEIQIRDVQGDSFTFKVGLGI